MSARERRRCDSPDGGQSALVNFERAAVGQNVYEASAARAKWRPKQTDAVAVGARLRVTGQRPRLRAHQRDARVRRKLHDSIKPAVQILRRRGRLPAAFGQPLVADARLAQTLGQHAPVELRPALARRAAHVAHEFNPVLSQKRNEVRPRVATVADGVDGDGRGRHNEMMNAAV